MMDRTFDFLEAIRAVKKRESVPILKEDLIRPKPVLNLFIKNACSLVCSIPLYNV